MLSGSGFVSINNKNRGRKHYEPQKPMQIKVPQADRSLIMPGVGEAASDVIVIGGGNAGLCAAISAAEAGASVTLLERAPIPYRGGNSRHTRNFRCSHGDDLGVLSGTYDLEEFYDDLLRVTKGNTDEKLAKHVIRNAPESYQWMAEHGVIFQPSLSGTLSLSRTNAFFLGGGKALVNAYYQRCEDLGVKIHYNATVLELQIEAGSCDGVLVDYAEHHITVVRYSNK